jgi:SAM-dependent methyltransferase
MTETYAADGSPVEFYALLPSMGEPEIIAALVPRGGTLLELGCGAGRLTRPLVGLGYRVVGVDQSAAMLAHVRDARTVLADIETLDLGRTFGGVVLAGHLVNTPDEARRAAFLRTCRRHVAPGGVVVVQRLDPAWLRSAVDGVQEWGGFRIALRDVRRAGAVVSAVSEYATGGRVWRQPWTMRILSDIEIEMALASAGLRVRRWAGRNRTWLAAVPVGSSPETGP